MWSEEEVTPIGIPGISKVDIDVCNRVIYNEIGLLLTEEDKEEAIALVYSLINLSERIGLSIPKLVTGTSNPKEDNYGHKYRIFSTGRVALVSTIFPPKENNTDLINEIFSGHISDPLYGDWIFFNILEEEYPEYYRRSWGIDETSGIKTGLIYGKFEYSPLAFLRARAMGIAAVTHLNRWEKQKMNLV